MESIEVTNQDIYVSLMDLASETENETAKENLEFLAKWFKDHPNK